MNLGDEILEVYLSTARGSMSKETLQSILRFRNRRKKCKTNIIKCAKIMNFAKENIRCCKLISQVAFSVVNWGSGYHCSTKAEKVQVVMECKLSR